MTRVLHQFPTVAEGLALEADLFAAQEAGVGLWTSACNALVCPAAFGKRSGFGAASAQATSDGWPVFCRPTGGGAVPQGPGVLNLALAFTAPRSFTIDEGYRLITRIIRGGLGALGHRLTAGPTPDSFCDGDWNLSVAGKKVVGTAQRWRPVGPDATRVLAHALILVAGPIPPGARAVGAFNADLGLGGVAPEAHTTLEQTGLAEPGMLRVAHDLHRAAIAQFRNAENNMFAAAAA